MIAELIDSMGSDLTVVNAARVSFAKESAYQFSRMDGKVLYEKDEKLISYLAKHGHWTPFSHPQICIRETVPIFVARQRFKHMVGFTYNEVSRRYVDDDPKFFVPKTWRSRPEGGLKQGSGDDVVEEMMDPYFIGSQSPVADVYTHLLAYCESAYNRMLEAGVAPEQARMVLPQSMYTSYYVTGSLAAWARMYKQRIDSHAQVEIQDLAEQVGHLIAPLFPVSWNALME